MDGQTNRRTNRQTDRFAISISRISMLTRDKNLLDRTASRMMLPPHIQIKLRPRVILVFGLLLLLIIIITIIIIISSAALSKIRRAVGTCHSVLTMRCAFRRRAKVAVDSVDRRSSAGKLFQVSGPETAKFLRPMAVAVRCTSSLPEAADRRYHFICPCPGRPFVPICIKIGSLIFKISCSQI